MDKYIKRDDLLSLITTLRNHRLLGKCGGAEAWKMAKALPAADVEPVVHAHWYQLDEDILCSHCGKGYMGGDTPQEAKEHLDSGEAYDRCPHCGAHMDGGA